MPVIYHPSDFNLVINRIKDPATKFVAIDVETSGLSFIRNAVVGYVIGFSNREDDNYYIPVRHGGGNNSCDWPGLTHSEELTGINIFKQHPFEIELNEALKQRGKTIVVVGHNIGFDLRFLAKHGVFTNNSYDDTMINASLIYEYHSSYSLDYLCRYCGVTAKLGDELYGYIYDKLGGSKGRNSISNYWKLPGDDKFGTEYAIGDGISTLDLWLYQQHKLDEELIGGNLRRIHKVECDLIPVLNRMTLRGIKVDEDRLHTVKELMEEMVLEKSKKLPDGLNTRSPKQMKELMELHGHTDWPVTDKGNPSFSEAFLRTNEIGREILDVKKIKHQLSAFIDPLIEKHLYNGRVHAEYNQSKAEDRGTVTGRLSCSNPNMQQITKRNKELGYLLRSVFIPDDGKHWRSVDYSQCEPRLLTHFSGCKVLRDGYLSIPPIDAHTSVSIAANIDRDSGKRLNQGLITGMGKKKLIADLGVGVNEGNKIYDQYFNKMPEIKQFQKNSASTLRHRGYIRSILGRVAHLKISKRGNDMSYLSVNRLLQSSNADVMKKSMVDADAITNGTNVDMLTNIHDSIDFQLPDTKQDIEVYNCAIAAMEDFGPGRSVELDIPLLVDEGIGKNWAEATYG